MEKELKTILIIDDSDFDRETLSEALSLKSQYKIIEVKNGEDGLKEIEKNKIDLVLLDIVMEGINGNDILVKIREKFNEIELPIIVITSMTNESDIIKSLQLRANDYLSKPVNFNIALTRIDTQIKLSKISREMSEMSKKIALNAIVVTYNHEINNQLTIAMSKLTRYINDKSNNESCLKDLDDSLWNISKIVKKIKENKDSLLYEKYSNSTNMLKLDKK